MNRVGYLAYFKTGLFQKGLSTQLAVVWKSLGASLHLGVHRPVVRHEVPTRPVEGTSKWKELV